MDWWTRKFHRTFYRLSNLRELLPSDDGRTHRSSIIGCKPGLVSGFLHRNRHHRPCCNPHPSFESNTTATSLRPSKRDGWAGCKRITAIIEALTGNSLHKFGSDPSSRSSIADDDQIHSHS